MTATLPLPQTAAPPLASTRVATGAAQPTPAQGAPDPLTGFQQVMQRAAGRGGNPFLPPPPQPDGAALATLPSPLPERTPERTAGLSLPVTTVASRNPAWQPADSTESASDPASDPLANPATLLLWPAPATLLVTPPIPPLLPASSPGGDSGATAQLTLPATEPPLGSALTVLPGSITRPDPASLNPAWPSGAPGAAAAEAPSWTTRSMASALVQRDAAAAHPAPLSAASGDEAARPLAPPALAGWPESSRLGPEAAALRERSTEAPGARAHELSSWLGSALPALNATPPSDPQVGASRPGNDSGPHALLSALGERIETQLQRGSERTVIRLDPPMQGQIEITLHRDAAGLQVQLSASHGEVLKQLQAISDGLRQDLASRHSGEVSVQVAQQDRRDGNSHGRQPQDDPRPQTSPGRALIEDSDDERQAGFGQRLASTFQRTSNLLP